VENPVCYGTKVGREKGGTCTLNAPEVPNEETRDSTTLLQHFCGYSVPAAELERDTSRFDEKQTEWIAGVLKAAQSVQVGMSRSDLLKVFTTEGGISTPSQRTYVYRECPYIKVDVKFAAASRSEEFSNDRIVKISRPYLAFSVMD